MYQEEQTGEPWQDKMNTSNLQEESKKKKKKIEESHDL